MKLFVNYLRVWSSAKIFELLGIYFKIGFKKRFDRLVEKGFDAPKSDWLLNWQGAIYLIGQFQISNCAPKLANQSPADGAPSDHR